MIPAFLYALRSVKPEGFVPTIVGMDNADANNIGDDSIALRTAIAELRRSISPWGDSRRTRVGVIYFPEPLVNYRFKSTVEIPTTLSVYLVGPGIHGARLKADNGVAIRRLVSVGGFHSFGLWGMQFDGSGVQIAAQSRNQHFIQQVMFKRSPVGLDLLDNAGEGGIVGGKIADCEFEECVRALRCTGQNSDNWKVESCQFTHNEMVDLEIRSSGWQISSCYFEQKSGAADQPYVQLAGNVSNLRIYNCDFRSDVSAQGQPPRESVLVGEIGQSDLGHVGSISFDKCTFQGRNGGPTATSAESAVRFNVGVNGFRFTNCAVTNTTQVLNPQHANTGDGLRNFVQVPHGYGDIPLFSRGVSRGSNGNWRVVGDDISVSDDTGRATTSMLTSSDYTDASWTKANISVAKNVIGPDGVADSAFTFTKSSSGVSASVSANPSTPNGDDPARYRVWLKKAPGSDIETALLGFFPVHGFSGGLVQLTDTWVPHDIWIPEHPNSVPTVYVLVGSIGGADTGDMYVSAPECYVGFGK